MYLHVVRDGPDEMYIVANNKLHNPSLHSNSLILCHTLTEVNQ